MTDSKYGVTGELRQREQCGFLQCTDLKDPVGFHEDLRDPSYETGRVYRALQARKLLRRIQSHRSNGRLLDVDTANGFWSRRHSNWDTLQKV